MFHSFLIALQFLTRLPVFIEPDYALPRRLNAILFYPLIGLMIGGLLYITQLALTSVEPLLAAAIILSLWVMITGGLHLDGLADSADAWAGGLGDVQRSLEIMKDPRSGALAIVVLIVFLLLKFAAIYVLIKQQQVQWLIISPLCGRAAVVLLLMITPYARKNGLGSEMAEQSPRLPVAISLLLSIGVLFFWLRPAQWLLLLTMLLVVFYFIRRLMMQRIGGMTGDTAGAMIELIELSVLLLAAIFFTAQ